MKDKLFSEKISGYMIIAICSIILYLFIQNKYNNNIKNENSFFKEEIIKDSMEYELIMEDFRKKDSISWIENPVIKTKIVKINHGDDLCSKFGWDQFQVMSFFNRTSFPRELDSKKKTVIYTGSVETEFVINTRKNGEKIIYENTPDVYCLMTEDILDK